MDLKVKGHLSQILPLETGTTKAGKEWKKRSIIIQTFDKYSKKVCIVLFGDKVDLLDRIYEKDMLEIGIDIESRDFNGRWYTDVSAYSIRVVNDSSAEVYNSPVSSPQPRAAIPVDNGGADPGEDDLPF